MPIAKPAVRLAAAALLLAALACGSDPTGSDPVTTVSLGSDATSAQIQAARDAADGTGLSLPVTGAYVTYVRPLPLGADPAGFAIQSQRAGPALFVAVDPATLYPTPVLAGDRVDLVITELATVDGRRQAAAVTGYARLAWDQPVSLLQQDLSAAGDLVSTLGAYESELSAVRGTLRTTFTSSGSGFAAAGLDTAALSNEPLLLFRLPTTLRDTLDLALGCRVATRGVPLWRNGATALANAWAAADVVVEACPAPRVASAAALSSTSVRVTFDRVIEPATVLADGSQFAFGGGLVAVAAAASGRTVTITTASQVPAASYTVTVAATVRDLYGTGVDPAFAQASFAGFVVPATVRLTEVNANVAASADLVELEVVGGGSTNGIVLETGVATATLLATLPDATVAPGELIVVHLAPVAGITTETSGKTACTDAACYPGAWDVAGGAAGIAATSRVLVVRSAQGDVLDAVPFSDGSTSGGLSSFLADLQALQADGLWLPADCGGATCTLSSTPTALDVSADWTGMGTTATGESVRRTAGADTHTAADWTVGASSFGAAN